jgi:hypothetical protein
MDAATEELERELAADVGTLDDRLVDEEFATELYRALAGRMWRKDGGPEGHVSFSWGRAEELVNDLRGRVGEPALTLAQTGGEGELSGLVAGELGRLGWQSTPLNPERRDPGHVERPASPPPRGDGAAHAPAEDPRGWEREAHAEAERRRRRDQRD